MPDTFIITDGTTTIELFAMDIKEAIESFKELTKSKEAWEIKTFLSQGGDYE